MATFIALINLILFLTTISKVKAFTIWILENTPQKIPPEQLAQVKGFAANAALISGGVGVVLAPFLTGMMIALVFKLFNMFSGEETSFKKFYAIGVITYVPMLFKQFLRTLLVALSPVERFASINTSAALALPPGTTGPLYAVLAQIDPFNIWTLVLLAIGTALAMKISVRKTGIFIFILWLLMAAVSVAILTLNPQPYIGA